MVDEDRDHALEQRLRSWAAPQSSADERAHLLATLTADLPVAQPNGWVWAGLIIRSQLRVVHRVIWGASALIMALGALVTAALYRPGMTGAELPIALIAPFIAALGAAFLYGEEVDPTLELQWTTPISPRLVLLARLALVFGFNLALTGLAALPLAIVGAGGAAFGLIGAWLAPMTALTGLAFLASVLWVDPGAGAFLAAVVWGLSVWRRFAEADALPPIVSLLPDVYALEVQPMLIIGAVGCVIIGLLLAERESVLGRSE